MDADNEAMVRALEAAGHHEAARVLRAAGQQAQQGRSLAGRVAGGRPPMADEDSGEPLTAEAQAFAEQIREAQKHGGWHVSRLDEMTRGSRPGRF